MNNTANLKREVLVKLIRAFLSENFEKNTDKIPFEMRPKDSDVPYRCCIHKERAILRSRTIATLGFAIEEDDEQKHLSEYAKEASQRENITDKKVLTFVDTACKGCVPSRVYITNLCQGCVARHCIHSCKFGAISMKNGKAVIDGEKCKNCGMCINACHYKAIVKLHVPCEEACAVGAITKKESGVAVVDYDKCISCGHCISACPFGAIHEKSQIIDILKHIKSNKRVVAMIAPSVVGQLPCSIEQLKTGLLQAGFSSVEEVALGADLTAIHEAKDFKERMEKNDDFMTTSCCAAYKELVKKHIPEMQQFVSDTPTPMHFTAEFVKQQDPDCISVFIGPCVAKRFEGLNDDLVDYVMSFEEMGALFIALKIELANLDATAFEDPACDEGRRFGISGGVSKSVVAANNSDYEVQPVLINGLNKDTKRQLTNYAKKGNCPDGNLVEVMICEGGCVNGAGVINTVKATTKKINEFSDNSKKLKEKHQDI